MTATAVPAQRRAGSTEQDDIATLVHDLRQCVSAGLLLSDLPFVDRVDHETRRRFELIQQTLTHAAAMLDTAVDDTALPHREMNLAEVAQECVNVAEFAHKLRFTDDSSEIPVVLGDRLMLHRALDNVIDNAGRAAGEAGDVVVLVGNDHRYAWVEVTDDGPGFGAIQHGSGKGLSVVSSTARACGGRLDISSGPGPGTTVRLSIPRRQQPPMGSER